MNNLSHELSKRFQYAPLVLESGYQEVSPQVVDQVYALLRPVSENLATIVAFGTGRVSMQIPIASAIRSHLKRPL